MRSITAGVSVCRRENASSWRVRLSPRLVAFAIISSRWTCSIPGEFAPQTLHAAADDHQKIVEVVATPPVNCPIASRRWACRNAASAASRRSASS